MFKKATQKGFTLIELLVVIAIIALLSSVVMASLNTARAKARDARRISDVRQIITAVELARNDNKGGKPPNTNGVAYCLGTSSCWGGPINNPDLDAAISKYLKPIPLDPQNNRGVYNAYLYRSPGRYWLPELNTISGGVDSYSIAWYPDGPDNIQPTSEECESMGGIWAAWDQPPGGVHCPPGGSCRQCGILIKK